MTTYKEAGVDIDAGSEAISRIKKHVRATFNANVLTDLGGFGGFGGLPWFSHLPSCEDQHCIK